MEYAAGGGSDWRREIEDWLKEVLQHRAFNPNKESRKYLLKKSVPAGYQRWKKSNPRRFMKVVRGIVAHDSREIAGKSDYLICYWDRGASRGAGTQGEVTMARYFGKPVYLVTQNRISSIPGWILGCTTEIFHSFEELKQFLRKRYH